MSLKSIQTQSALQAVKVVQSGAMALLFFSLRVADVFREVLQSRNLHQVWNAKKDSKE